MIICRRTLLPVLSKRWAGLLQGFGPVWEKVDIDAGAELLNVTEADTAAMAAWFGSRAGSVRRLRVLGSVPKLPASLLMAALMSQAASLRAVYLELGAAPLSGADVGVLAALTALEDLAIELPVGPHAASWDDHGASLIGALSRLPALQVLALGESSWAENFTELPTVSELAALRSPMLSHIECSMASTPNGNLVLGALPALERCSLIWRDSDERGLHLTADSFSATPRLTSLSLQVFGGQLQLALRAFGGLSQLTHLALSSCGLDLVPVALVGVQHMLRELDLSYNDGLQIDEEGVAILLELRRLRTVELKKHDLGEDCGGTGVEEAYDSLPALWTVASVTYLADFRSTWQSRHVGATPPKLSF